MYPIWGSAQSRKYRTTVFLLYSFWIIVLNTLKSHCVCVFSFSCRVKHRSDPGGSGGGHQWDREALPQAREGGERRQSRQAPTCGSIIYHKWGKAAFCSAAPRAPQQQRALWCNSLCQSRSFRSRRSVTGTTSPTSKVDGEGIIEHVYCFSW